jgi:hypothetical protein
MDLFDKASVKQLLDLLMDEVLPLNGLSPRLLAHWPGMGWIFRWCSITSLGILGICDGSQVKTSTFARRKVTSASSYFSPRLPAMRVVWEESAPTWMVFTGSPSVPDGCTLVGALVPEVEGSLPRRPGEQLPSQGREASQLPSPQRRGHPAR